MASSSGALVLKEDGELIHQPGESAGKSRSQQNDCRENIKVYIRVSWHNELYGKMFSTRIGESFASEF